MEWKRTWIGEDEQIYNELKKICKTEWAKAKDLDLSIKEEWNDSKKIYQIAKDVALEVQGYRWAGDNEGKILNEDSDEAKKDGMSIMAPC